MLADAVAATDVQLLDRFRAQQDAAAFEALVRRHGPMVLRVCKRILFERADAEDAFQAVFLVLVRKAESVEADRLANWLYGVAYRVSLKARDNRRRRADHERAFATTATPSAGDEPRWDDVRPVLDEELTRLPDKFRAPLVLCYLQGKTVDETADQLGWKRGTAASRLARGRDMLRNRLARRGLTLSAAALLAMLATDTASAAVPAALATATTSAVASGSATCPASVTALADAAIRSMMLAKVKTASAIATALALLVGTMAWAIAPAPRTPPATGFVSRVWQPGTAAEARYTVFVPPSYTGDTPYPAILFLHGIDAKGTDGVKPTRSPLGAAIRKRQADFPFIVVFPQLVEGDFEGSGPGAKRAIAMLDDVARDYRIDRRRVSLVGWSLGGIGAWSVAASQPDRWAAVVPVGGGGDSRQASKLVRTPIWAFHGSADKLVSIQRDRDMIAALQAAGGAPRFTEYPGGDHGSAAAAFGDDALYQWLLAQRSP